MVVMALAGAGTLFVSCFLLCSIISKLLDEENITHRPRLTSESLAMSRIRELWRTSTKIGKLMPLSWLQILTGVSFFSFPSDPFPPSINLSSPVGEALLLYVTTPRRGYCESPVLPPFVTGHGTIIT